jgi:inosine-uridine nucleoside N-ribohydrolase
MESFNRLKGNQKWRQILKSYIKYYEENTVFDGAVMYDSLAAAISVKPGIADFKGINAVVETEGKETRGILVPERPPQKDNNYNLRFVNRLKRDVGKEIFSKLSEELAG